MGGHQTGHVPQRGEPRDTEVLASMFAQDACGARLQLLALSISAYSLMFSCNLVDRYEAVFESREEHPMAVIEVSLAAMAAGRLLLRVGDYSASADALIDGSELATRAWKIISKSPEQRAREKTIKGFLSSKDYAGADSGDVKAADLAVKHVFDQAPGGTVLLNLIRRNALGTHLQEIAEQQAKSLGNEPAQAVFWMIMSATERYVIESLPKDGNFTQTAHLLQLQDFVRVMDKLSAIYERISATPKETVHLLAGDVLTLQPTVPTRSTNQPSRLLAPTSGVFPFMDIGGSLKDLIDWADSSELFSVMVIGGRGGSGKSRLGVELCRHLRGRGGYWDAGFLKSQKSEQRNLAIQKLRLAEGARLVVIDYAETRAQEVAEVISGLASSAEDFRPVRILLLVRNPKTSYYSVASNYQSARPWKDAVRTYDDEVAEQLIDSAHCIVLNEESFSQADRVKFYRDAAGSLALFLDRPLAVDVMQPGLEFLDSPQYSRPLFLVVAAYLTIMDGSEADLRPENLFEGLLVHESKHWRRTLKPKALKKKLGDNRLRLLVAFSALAAPTDKAGAMNLLKKIDFLSKGKKVLIRRQVFDWFQVLYPATDGTMWGHLEPDSLAEYLIARELASEQRSLSAVINIQNDSRQLVRPFTVLARACADYDDLAGTIAGLMMPTLEEWCTRAWDEASVRNPWASVAWIEALARLVEVLGPRWNRQDLTQGLSVLDYKNRIVLPLALALNSVAIKKLDEATPPEVRGELLNDYSIRLDAVGRRVEALAAIEEAVGLYRRLAEANPAAYEPDLAASLHNYSIQVGAVGRHVEALAPIEEAVGLYRRLAAEMPQAYGGRLGNSLLLYSRLLQKLGRAREAEDAENEAEKWVQD
ncbi:MAG: hypothetical protein WAQ31_03290 [Arcanobacterium sp.]